jgi:hypothetical protein
MTATATQFDDCHGSRHLVDNRDPQGSILFVPSCRLISSRKFLSPLRIRATPVQRHSTAQPCESGEQRPTPLGPQNTLYIISTYCRGAIRGRWAQGPVRQGPKLSLPLIHHHTGIGKVGGSS